MGSPPTRTVCHIDIATSNELDSLKNLLKLGVLAIQKAMGRYSQSA
jgi:hypothetical protein